HNEALLDRTLAGATALTYKAVAVSRQFDALHAVSTRLLAGAEQLVYDLAELGGETPHRRFRKAAMLVEFARNYAALGAGELQRSRAAEAEGLMQRLAAEASNSSPWLSDLSATYDDLGDVMQSMGRLTEAYASYRASAAIAERIAADPRNGGPPRDLIASYIKVGNAALERGALEEALASYQLGLAVGEPLAAGAWRHGRGRAARATAPQKTGAPLRRRGELEAAPASYQTSRALAEELIATDAGHADWRRALAAAHVKIGDVLALQDKPEDALASYRVSHAMAERFADDNPGNLDWQHELRGSHERLGALKQAQGDLAGALKEYRASLAIAARLGARDAARAGCQRALGLIHRR